MTERNERDGVRRGERARKRREAKIPTTATRPTRCAFAPVITG